MKKPIYILGLILLALSAVYGQKAAVKKSAPSKSTALKKTAAATGEQREKFNPLANPEEDLQAAIRRAQTENKRIILDIGGEWCGWCVKMDNYFLENKALLKVRDDNFVWVKVNMSPENENKTFLAKFPAVQGYPHLFVLETDGSLLHSQPTAELEEPPLPTTIQPSAPGRAAAEVKPPARSYDLFKFVEFLKLWSSQ